MSNETDVIVVGAGLAGLVAAAELIDAGRRVIVLDQEPEASLGGQAFWSFGGLFLVDSPVQRHLGIRDSHDLALQDWLGSAGFDREEDLWPRRWAEAYVDFASGEKYSWLRERGVGFFPVVQWAERGGYLATGHGNSVPRFHVTWGTGPGVLEPFVRRVREGEKRGLVTLRFRHRVTELTMTNGVVDGVHGEVLEPSSRVVTGEFTETAQDAPDIHAGEEWAYLIWGGSGRVGPLPLDNLHQTCDTTEVMKIAITAKLKLHTTPEQFQALRQTQLTYRDALNYVSEYAFEHGKMSNKVRLQDGTYDEVRARYKIPAQMACSIPRQVGATYKTLWTKVKQNAAQRKAGITKKRYKGLDQPPKYVSPTLTYQLGHDYSFKTDERVSILTLQGRVILPYTGYDKHIALIRTGTHIGAAKLWYDKARKQFYLLVSLEVEVADPTPETHTQVVGVDVGVRYLAVTSTTKGDCTFHTGKSIVPKANHYTRLRKRLQKKGTRSATRRLVVISGRERRLKQDANHVVSTRIIDRHPHSLIGLENLTDIRERTKRKRGKKASRKQRRANAAYSKWSFAELQSMLAYKALLHSSMAIKVDAHYTSKACPVCGHTCDANRPHKGLLFVCQNCHYSLHADLVGARNITMRTILARQDWARTGRLSIAPDVSDAKTKAARLARYAELRWSPDTSPRALAGGN